MNFQRSNRLVDSYQNRRQQIPVNNNAFLQNNPMFMSNPNMNAAQMRQIQMMQMMQMEEMKKQKRMQEMKLLEKANELEKKYGQSKIRESVIKPQKLSTDDNKEVEGKYRSTQKEYPSEKTRLWKGRTNQPYKNIIKDDNATRSFKDMPRPDKEDQRRELRKKLIIHRVTDADKEGVDEEFENLQKTIKNDDNEIKKMYSTSKFAENKKKFEYNHKYKYRMSHNTKDHNQTKQDTISYLKKQQEKEEDMKEKRDQIIEDLLEEGIFDEEEVRQLKAEQSVADGTQSTGTVIKTKSSPKREMKQEERSGRKVIAPPKRTERPKVEDQSHRQHGAVRPGQRRGTALHSTPQSNTQEQDARRKEYQKRQKRPNGGRGRTFIV